MINNTIADYLILGTVIDSNIANDSSNSVKVKLEPSNMEIEARVLSLFAGKKYGVIAKPDKGEEVVVAFMGGHLDQAVILGSVYNKTNKVKNINDTKNEKKYVLFDSGASVDINKSGCTIKTSKDHIVNFDDKNEKLLIKNKNGKMKVSIGFKSSEIEISCNKMKISAGKTTVSIDDQGVNIKNATGKCNIDVQNFKVNAKSNAEIKSTAGTKVTSSANVDVKATGILNLKGSMAKIN